MPRQIAFDGFGGPPSERPSSTSRRRLYELLASSGPLTDEEMQDALGMNPSTERPRRIELVEALLVRDSGKRRKTRSGRRAVVWEVREP